nr:pre-mRNA-splicing factor ATP-dependent RNA helicase DEAH7 [Tanacetum cinerariifolium]
MSVAKRVGEEMEVELGDKVGYAILLEDVTGSKTVIKVMIDAQAYCLGSLKKLLPDVETSSLSSLPPHSMHNTFKTSFAGDVVDVYISYEKMYALLEMRSVEETQKCNGFGRHLITGNTFNIDQSSLIGKSLPITWDLYEMFRLVQLAARVTLYGKVAHQKVVIANVVTLFRKVAHQTA